MKKYIFVWEPIKLDFNKKTVNMHVENEENTSFYLSFIARVIF